MIRLWNSPPVTAVPFDPDTVQGLPEPARRYLLHAIAPGALMASTFSLGMRGQIKLNGAWCGFKARQVTRAGAGFVWRARVTMKGLPVVGSDRWIDGHGAMAWKLLGLFPVVTAAGPDISRSGLGRMQGEMVWLPTALMGDGVKWSSSASDHVRVEFQSGGHPAALDLQINGQGGLVGLAYQRWGNPEGAAFGHHTFGGVFDAEGTFQGITIPTRMNIGWNYRPGRKREEWEGFRATIKHIEFK